MDIKTIREFFNDLRKDVTDVKTLNSLHRLQCAKIKDFKITGHCTLDKKAIMLACK